MTAPSALDRLATIRDFIRYGSSEFNRNELVFGHGFADAVDEARYLVLHALALPPDLPAEYLDAALTEAERGAVIDLLEQRVATRKPAAYLTREAWFCGLSFYVDERVLVPRSPFAELIAGHFEPWIDSHRVGRILDLCCGSACIAIAAQYAFRDAEVTAADLSRDALDVAAINLERHGLDGIVELCESDLFASIPRRPFDIIACNPPYVDADEMASLPAEFRHEPVLGLAAGADGLALVDRIFAGAGDYLADEGLLFLEVGNSMAALDARYGFLPLTWIDFEHGGAGVCCIRGADLKQSRDEIVRLAG